jgi:hypothetical protein
VWLAVCYRSPCVPLPPSAREISAANAGRFGLGYFDGPGSLWPRLWCSEPGTYAAWGQLFAMPIEGSGEARRGGGVTGARRGSERSPRADSARPPSVPGGPPLAGLPGPTGERRPGLLALPAAARAVRALMSVQPPAAAEADAGAGAIEADDFLFSLSTLGLFAACAFAGLLLTYGVAAPTGGRFCPDGTGRYRPAHIDRLLKPGGSPRLIRPFCLIRGSRGVCARRGARACPCVPGFRPLSPHTPAPGIFIPTMAIGAAVGRLAGRALQAAVSSAGLTLQASPGRARQSGPHAPGWAAARALQP